MTTPFTEILRRAVNETPGAIGGAFAAGDGETVDYVSDWRQDDWAVLTAHYGVIFAHVQTALHTFHFGEARQVVLSYEGMHIVMQSVLDGYFALLAVSSPPYLARAMQAIDQGSEQAAGGDLMTARGLRSCLALTAMWLALAASARTARASDDYRLDSDRWNGLSTLRALAEGMGLEVVTSHVVDWEDIGPGDVLIMLYPTQRLDPTNLAEFLHAGGRLFLGDDFGESSEALVTLGMVREDGVGVDAIRYHDQHTFAPIARAWLPDHPLANGVPELATNHPAILPNVEGPEVVFGFGSGEALVAVGQLGAGRFVVTSDPSMLINRMLQFESNFNFAINVIRFLAVEGDTQRLVVLTGDFALHGTPATADARGGVGNEVSGVLSAFDRFLRELNLYLMPKLALQVLGALLAIGVAIVALMLLPLGRKENLDGNWTRAGGGPAYLDSVEAIVGYFDQNGSRHSFTLPACVLRDSLNTRLSLLLGVADPIHSMEPDELLRRIGAAGAPRAAEALTPVVHRLRELPTRAQAISPLATNALPQREFQRLHVAAERVYRSLEQPRPS